MIRVGCHLWRYSVALGGVLVFFRCTLFTADHMQFLLFFKGEVQLGELYYSSRKRKNIQRGVLLRTLSRFCEICMYDYYSISRRLFAQQCFSELQGFPSTLY